MGGRIQLEIGVEWLIGRSFNGARSARRSSRNIGGFSNSVERLEFMGRNNSGIIGDEKMKYYDRRSLTGEIRSSLVHKCAFNEISVTVRQNEDVALATFEFIGEAWDCPT